MTKAQADQFILDQLKRLGAGMSQPREVIHYLYLPSGEAARQAAEALQSKGYRTEDKMAANANINRQNPYLVLAKNHIVASPQAVQELRRLFEELASFHNGEYDGWEAAAKP
ncbi:MAG TPA: ribonuclease E inhibitor RraB [Candidatus Acidoferrales bacterium]|nr:ribonuclease E inhibitor RraB [Candidatus Acidoferrales bacterium]